MSRASSWSQLTELKPLTHTHTPHGDSENTHPSSASSEGNWAVSPDLGFHESRARGEPGDEPVLSLALLQLQATAALQDDLSQAGGLAVAGKNPSMGSHRAKVLRVLLEKRPLWSQQLPPHQPRQSRAFRVLKQPNLWSVTGSLGVSWASVN